MSLIRIAFLGTPEFAAYHLQKLIEDEHFEVVGVLSQPDRPAGRKMQLQPSAVKKIALQNQIPVLTPGRMTQEALETVKSWRAEAAVVVAYGQILPQSFLDLFPQKVVNVHASLLPRWRGAAPIQRAIMAGDAETGVALQVMVKKLDAGDILGIRKIKVTDDMNALQLHDALKVLGADLLHIEFMDYLRGNLMPSPQDENGVTYAKKLEKSEGEIDWTLPGQDIVNLVRGMSLGPGTYTFLNDKKIKILSLMVASTTPPKELPGTITDVSSANIIVSCGDGHVKILELQPESRSKMAVSEYLKGYPIKAGDRFENLPQQK